MKVRIMCEEGDGLVLVDKSFLEELQNDDLLYAMDILLDRKGTSELVCDFSDEKWDIVWPRESKIIREFCNTGKMIIWLTDSIETVCELKEENKIDKSSMWLNAPSGKLLGVSASELIQCLAYPELEMEKLFELDVDAGWYQVLNEGIESILYCKQEPKDDLIQNVQIL